MSISPGWAGTAGSDCGSDCGKRLATAVLKRLATAVLEEVRRVLEERIGSGGNKVVQFMACTHRGCSYVLLPGKRNAAIRIPAVLAISYRVVVGLQRSCGSSINPEVICRKKHELRENSGITKLLHQGTRRTTNDPPLATGIFACVLNRHPDAQESRQPRPIGVERVSTVRGQRGVITTESYRQYRQPISDGNICVCSRPTSRRTE